MVMPYKMIQSDTGQNVIGGLSGGLGAGYAAYEYVHASKVRHAWDNIIIAWEELKLLIDDYALEVNAVVAQWDQAYINGIVPNDDFLSVEMANIAEKEKRMAELLKIILDNVDAAEDAIDDPPFIPALVNAVVEGMFDFTANALGIWKKAVVGLVVGVPVGLGIYKIWQKVRDHHNDSSHPSGTSVTMPDGKTVTAPTSELLKLEIMREIELNYVVNTAAIPSVVPAFCSAMAQLPSWVQTSMAVEMGIRPEVILSEADVRRAFMTDYRILAAVAGVAILCVVCWYASPAIIASLAALSPAVAPALVRVVG